ncbi:thiamine diphosphokinase [Clostridium senegalense]|uniref:Thiamine diphosphokinase n=1 Tax=Clostridium senegalense TaxID=1465809 RepID=A0A6M0GZM9_9CLOT|nr:thiamine diphosphokinase [Clostridium senegalense]NEU03293.1 thiamine diphosphokinase [Clostridium senegalense]
MKWLIISGGTPPKKETILKYTNDGFCIIAADSGANSLYKYNIIPKILLGDFDSIDKKVLEYFKDKCEITKYPKEKDYTDTEIALEKAIELSAKKIVFLGCTGTRIDHLIGNLCILNKAINRGVEAYIVDENNKITMTSESKTIYGKRGELFSVFAFNKKVEKLSVKNAKYELKDYDLEVEDSLTVSNEFAENEVHLEFLSGTLMIIRSVD